MCRSWFQSESGGHKKCGNLVRKRCCYMSCDPCALALLAYQECMGRSSYTPGLPRAHGSQLMHSWPIKSTWTGSLYTPGSIRSIWAYSPYPSGAHGPAGSFTPGAHVLLICPGVCDLLAHVLLMGPGVYELRSICS